MAWLRVKSRFLNASNTTSLHWRSKKNIRISTRCTVFLQVANNITDGSPSPCNTLTLLYTWVIACRSQTSPNVSPRWNKTLLPLHFTLRMFHFLGCSLAVVMFELFALTVQMDMDRVVPCCTNISSTSTWSQAPAHERENQYALGAATLLLRSWDRTARMERRPELCLLLLVVPEHYGALDGQKNIDNLDEQIL